jgi:hypothetical protein
MLAECSHDLLSAVSAALVSPSAITRRSTVFAPGNAASSAIVMNAAWRAIQAARDSSGHPLRV